MQEHNYYVVLKENVTFDIEVAEKIENMQLLTPEERFPFKDMAIEVYFCGTNEECENYKDNLNDHIRNFFEIKMMNKNCENQVGHH